MMSWPAPIVQSEGGEDLLWKSIQKRDNSWDRLVYSSDKKDNFASYQTKNIIMYGQGTLPTIAGDKETYTIQIPQ